MSRTAMTREELLVDLAGRILALPEAHPVLVAVDGMSCVGKTTLAGALADVVRGAGRPVIPVSYADFHHDQARRRRRGRLSAQGYLEDCYDGAALERLVLAPLAAGERRIVPAAYDLAGDMALEPVVVEVAADAVVLVEGEFVLGLGPGWDLGVLLVAEPAVLLERALVRDAELGSAAALRETYLRRYLGAWALYEERSDPWATADVVVDLADPHAPRLLR